MSDTDDTYDELGIDEQDAERLLADDSDSDGPDNRNDRQQRPDRDTEKLQADRDKWKSMARKHENERKQLAERLAKYEDANKSELERLTEDRDRTRSEAAQAKAEATALRIAMDRAPEHATLAQVRAVAKRVRGDDDDSLAEDADELFELLAPVPAEPKPSKTPSRPKERLRGGSEPDEEPETNDPRALAALVPRRR